MIRVLRPAVSMSIQDLGRAGRGNEGHCRSGAMDTQSLRVVNSVVGAPTGSAVVEIGPGPCTLQVGSSCTLAFGGAKRRGAPWWTSLDVRTGEEFELSSPLDGLWSYLAVRGGVRNRRVLGSRSTCVREGIGAWIGAGYEIEAGRSFAKASNADPPSMTGSIRVYGTLGSIVVGKRLDRMGYELIANVDPTSPEELSEPTMPGFVQALPSGRAFALMAEAPTLGGYPVIAVIHPDDLRLLAQARPGQRVHVTPIPAD